MRKRPVSLTLDEGNLLWLKGRGQGHGNLSAAVDDLITAARASGVAGVIVGRALYTGAVDLRAALEIACS